MSNKKISEVAIAQQLISEFSGQQVVFTLDALHCQVQAVIFINDEFNSSTPKHQKAFSLKSYQFVDRGEHIPSCI